MEPHQGTTYNGNSVDVEGEERLRSSSASSTSSSEFQDPLQVDSFEPGRNSSTDREKVEQVRREANGEEPTLQSPPVQTMERPDNGSGYRIPSCVFARNKSGGAPMEWSTASNESLFSLHTGNMSFTGDKYSWLLEPGEVLDNVQKSGELLPATTTTPETPPPEIPPVESPKIADPDHNPVNSAMDATKHDPNQVITPPENAQEKTNTSGGRKARPSMGDDQATPVSSRSNESGHSFAFPVLEGQLDRGGSSVKSIKSGLSSVPEKPEEDKKLPPCLESNEAETHEAPEVANSCSSCYWFGNCMSCFSCRMNTTEKDATGPKD